MLVKNHVVVGAMLAVSLLAAGCASGPAVNPASVLAPGQSLTLDESARLSGEAEQLMVERKLEQASERYVRVVTAYPNNAQAWFRLGIVYLRGQRYGYAQQAFQQTLRADPTLTKAQANLALAHLHQFRAAAVKATASAQVPSDHRKALASLVRDVDHAVTPGAAGPVAEQ